MNTLTRDQIAAALSSWPPERLWAVLLGQGRTLQPFWSRATRLFAERSQLTTEKCERYLVVIESAFDRMDDWRTKRVKYVRARRDEIDSAISFLRNRALDRSIATLRIAPVARNAAGALRGLLYIACNDYREDQLAELTAGNLFDLASVRTLFPFDFGTLASFNRGINEQPGLDPFVESLKRAGSELHIEQEVSALMAEVAKLWVDVENPPKWELPEPVWAEEIGPVNAKAHFTAVKAFHRPSSS